MSETQDETQDSEDQGAEIPETTPAGDQLPPQKRITHPLVVLLELVLLLVLGAVIWVKFTGQGQLTWEKAVAWWKTSAEQRAGAALQKRGVLVISEPPDQRITSVNFHGLDVDEAALGELAALFRVQSLDLTNTNISDEQLRSLGGLSSVSSLVLGGTPVTNGGMQHIESLAGIEALHLPSTKVSDEGLLHLGRITSLAVLDLSDTEVTDAGLKHLVPLRRLAWLLLENDEITDAGLKHIESIKSLKRVTLIGTKVSPEGADRLKRAIPGVTVDQ